LEGEPVAAESEETAKTQQPFAVILACADSRTAPAIIFDEVIRREHRNAYARARQMRVDEWIDEMVPMSDAVIGEEMSGVTATRNAIRHSEVVRFKTDAEYLCESTQRRYD
jgi:hypothetical protein